MSRGKSSSLQGQGEGSAGASDPLDQAVEALGTARDRLHAAAEKKQDGETPADEEGKKRKQAAVEELTLLGEEVADVLTRTEARRE